MAEEIDAHRKRVLGARHSVVASNQNHGKDVPIDTATTECRAPGLTLTGLYNVLEELRAHDPRSGDWPSLTIPNRASGKNEASGSATDADDVPTAIANRRSLEMIPKERDIHDRGLVSLLKQLHDDLDAAVSAAYGWPVTLTDAEILTLLVALNAQRAAEEKQGIIHWLRPDYQHPQGKGSAQGTFNLPTSKKTNPKSEIKNALAEAPGRTHPRHGASPARRRARCDRRGLEEDLLPRQAAGDSGDSRKPGDTRQSALERGEIQPVSHFSGSVNGVIDP